GVLRGFYQGLETTIPTAISQILEQIVNAAVSIGAAAILVHFAVESAALANNPSLPAAYGAAGGTIGTGAGALAALVFCIILMVKYRPVLLKNAARDPHKTENSYGNLLKVLTITAVPVIFSTAAYNSVDIIDSALFNHAMNARGIEEASYASVWGDYNNAFLTLVHLPVALSSAIASALVPALSAAHARHDKNEELSKIALTIRVTVLFAVPVSLGMMAIGGNLAKLLFRSISPEAERYLVVGGLSVLIFSLSTVSNAILQGLSHMEKPALHALIALAVQTVLLAVLLFAFKADIFAVIASYMVFGAVLMVLNLRSIARLSGYKIQPMKLLLLPFAIGAVMVVLLFLMSLLITRFVSGTAAHLFIVLGGLILGAIVYLVGILLSGYITKSQLEELPYGKKLVRFFTKLHLLRK
ncbi:MAG: polysaccharide biosynthesis C-terminal domain-containing protein, partial [Lachnospiraceae bacterium]|nr:polysaccharide biosynthesis C-terminal domain-containing protein [Lachnospiraceae bacterium]